MYPCTENPTYGIFVQEQESAIKQEFPNIHYTIAFVNGRHGKSEYIKSIFKIRKLIQEQSFDLIHIHYGFSGLFLRLHCMEEIFKQSKGKLFKFGLLSRFLKR